MRIRSALGIATAAATALAASAAFAATIYDYDALGRLIRVVYNNGASARYTYDAAGNRFTVCSRVAPPEC